MHVVQSMCQFYEYIDKVNGSIKIFTPLKNTNQITTDFPVAANYVQLYLQKITGPSTYTYSHVVNFSQHLLLCYFTRIYTSFLGTFAFLVVSVAITNIQISIFGG